MYIIRNTKQALHQMFLNQNKAIKDSHNAFLKVIVNKKITFSRKYGVIRLIKRKKLYREEIKLLHLNKINI